MLREGRGYGLLLLGCVECLYFITADSMCAQVLWLIKVILYLLTIVCVLISFCSPKLCWMLLNGAKVCSIVRFVWFRIMRQVKITTNSPCRLFMTYDISYNRQCQTVTNCDAWSPRHVPLGAQGEAKVSEWAREKEPDVTTVSTNQVLSVILADQSAEERQSVEPRRLCCTLFYIRFSEVMCERMQSPRSRILNHW